MRMALCAQNQDKDFGKVAHRAAFPKNIYPTPTCTAL